MFLLYIVDKDPTKFYWSSVLVKKNNERSFIGADGLLNTKVNDRLYFDSLDQLKRHFRKIDSDEMKRRVEFQSFIENL